MTAMTKIVSRDQKLPTKFKDYVSGNRSYIYWSSVMPTNDGTFSTKVIDARLKTLADASTVDGKQYRTRLEIGAGVYIPQWLLDEVGSYTYYDIKADGSIEASIIAKWWTPAYLDYYTKMHAFLASKYDGNPQIESIAMTATTIRFGEPMHRKTQTPQGIAELIAAGYTQDLDRAACDAMIAAHKAWTKTDSLAWISMWDGLNVDGTVANKDEALAFSSDFVRDAKASLPNMILGNNGVSEKAVQADGTLRPIYQLLKDTGGQMTSQTVETAKLDDLAGTIAAAKAFGATSIELPGNYNTWDDATVASVASQF